MIEVEVGCCCFRNKSFALEGGEGWYLCSMLQGELIEVLE